MILKKSNFLRKTCRGVFGQPPRPWTAYKPLFFSFLFIVIFELSSFAAISSKKLVYRVRHLWFFSLGKVTITAEPYLMDKQDIYQIAASYQSSRWLSIFYNIKGKANSYVDTKTLLPMRYEEFYSYPWHDDVNTVLIYDQEKKRVYIDRNGEKETKDIFEKTLDPLSALFFLREQPWKKGDTREFNLNNHQNNYQLTVFCDGKEKYRSQKTWHLKGFLKKYDEEKKLSDIDFQAWLLDDSSRLPVKLTIRTPYGNLLLRLKQ